MTGSRGVCELQGDKSAPPAQLLKATDNNEDIKWEITLDICILTLK